MNDYEARKVILVDADDQELGTMEKMEAHQKGKLHRAFSILVFNSNGDLLLQKRNRNKYHSGGLWTNTCCSHPTPGKPIEQCIVERLQYEMGISVSLTFSHKFLYRANISDLIEYELDHVFVGTSDATPKPEPQEVEDWCYKSIAAISDDIRANPNNYTYWLKQILTHREMLAYLHLSC